jgi:hypothetical protein
MIGIKCLRMTQVKTASLNLIVGSQVMASLRSLLLGAAMLSIATACWARPPAPGHPIVGTWTVTAADAACTETWEFRSDGTTHNVSGGEESTSEYEISELPNPVGAYRLIDTITMTNGQPDCTGNKTPVGDRSVLYLLPITGGGFMFCINLDGSACIGSIVRAVARDSYNRFERVASLVSQGGTR